MKRMIQAVAFLGLALIFTATAANAQSALTKRIKAEIPFTFTVGERTFSPGKYEIRISGHGSGVSALEVQKQGSDSVFTSLLMPNSAQSLTSGQLKFDRSYGIARLAVIVNDGLGYSVPGGGPSRLLATTETNRNESNKN